MNQKMEIFHSQPICLLWNLFRMNSSSSDGSTVIFSFCCVVQCGLEGTQEKSSRQKPGWRAHSEWKLLSLASSTLLTHSLLASQRLNLKYPNACPKRTEIYLDLRSSGHKWGVQLLQHRLKLNRGRRLKSVDAHLAVLSQLTLWEWL